MANKKPVLGDENVKALKNSSDDKWTEIVALCNAKREIYIIALREIMKSGTRKVNTPEMLIAEMYMIAKRALEER